MKRLLVFIINLIPIFGSAENCKRQIIILDPQEIKDMSEGGLVYTNPDSESVQIDNELYKKLKKKGRVVEVENMKSMNCTGGLTD